MPPPSGLPVTELEYLEEYQTAPLRGRSNFWRLPPAFERAAAAREKRTAAPSPKSEPEKLDCGEELNAEKSEPPVMRFSDYAGLIESLREMKNYLQLSNATVDRLCGWTAGHCDKLLGPSCVRALSPKTFGDLMWCFALEGTFTLNMDRVRAMETLWEQRCASNTRTKPNRISKRILDAARPAVLRELARKAGNASAARRRERKIEQQRATEKEKT